MSVCCLFLFTSACLVLKDLPVYIHDGVNEVHGLPLGSVLLRILWLSGLHSIVVRMSIGFMLVIYG